jgi:HTH-type transcriptional regulator, transcriptional repressor of NAD biosynthesis genes
MTALPPMKAHGHLIQWARYISDEVHVLLVIQPNEPYGEERAQALRAFSTHHHQVFIHVIQGPIEENPEVPGFWEMWRAMLMEYGCRPGDYVVTSEDWGNKLAEVTGTRFMPYDPERSVHYSRATHAREEYLSSFGNILPEFQPYLRRTVTFFGAESTGKTSLSKHTARTWYAHWIPEWARPFLEHAKNELTIQSMTEIWRGQYGLQKQVQTFRDRSFIIQDTDLMTTLGYWQFWDPASVPAGLEYDAVSMQSDLYIVTQSNIPFEVDPLRYGGDKRESTDQYWIDLCEKYHLNYVVLKSSDFDERTAEVFQHMNGLANKVQETLRYERRFQPPRIGPQNVAESLLTQAAR